MVFLAAALSAGAAEVRRPGPETVSKWQARKFGMFIHFGLYSELGGVWKGRRITRGYSEQIMRFVPATREEYAALAKDFDPVNWDPEAIVKLAQDAGMKFIVITAKHHDGFNMFGTRLTDFNIVDASPYRTDIVKGLAEACARRGMSFGVYYSTIDWHDKRATPPSKPPERENDNLIPRSHEDFNVAQLEELATRYGPLSEIWFDMGQPTPEQSKRFADTVHRFQPECMVSGRVFNSQGDFTVMGDNQIPTAILDEPWQTPASIYPDTWGYRSWEERTGLAGKTREHILQLVEVVSRGGNYLLNIGPRGDGSVVEFEADLLRGAGKWVHPNAEAIYDTQPQPFRKLDFGYATVKPGRLYLMVSQRPAGGLLRLPGLRNTITRAYFLADPSRRALPVNNASGVKNISMPDEQKTPPVTVVVAEFDGPLRVVPPSVQADASGVLTLEASQATSFYNYNGRGYYDPPTVYKQRWDFAPSRAGAYRVEVFYRESETGGPLAFAIGKRIIVAELQRTKGDQAASAKIGTVEIGSAESTPFIVTPKPPYAKGAKLGVRIEKIVLTPVAR